MIWQFFGLPFGSDPIAVHDRFTMAEVASNDEMRSKDWELWAIQKGNLFAVKNVRWWIKTYFWNLKCYVHRNFLQHNNPSFPTFQPSQVLMFAAHPHTVRRLAIPSTHHYFSFFTILSLHLHERVPIVQHLNSKRTFIYIWYTKISIISKNLEIPYFFCIIYTRILH